MKTLFRIIARFYVVILFIILSLFSLFLIIKYNYYQGTKINTEFNDFSGVIYQTYNNATDYFYLKENNQMLLEENAALKAKIRMSYLIYDDSVFVNNDTTYHLQYTYMAAKIISNSTSGRNNYLMLNKGALSGVKQGMAVIAPEGIIGVVKAVSPHFCSVMSMLHRDSRITAKLKRGGYAGSLVWDGISYATGELLDVPSHFKIKIGDTIISSGYSLDVPEGIMLGTIKKINTRGGDNFHKLVVKFSVDYKKIDYVYIVNNLFKEEQEKLRKIQSSDE